MSQHNNTNAVSTGLVFAYDQANPKSYKGPPLQNFLTGISPTGISDNGTTYRFFSGTEQVYIPEVGALTSAYVDMYNDYNGGSNNCCPSPYSYGSIGSITGNTQYTYGILYKSYNRYTNPNWMYHYEYGPNGYITEYGVHMVGGYSGQETHLGDGWYWSRAIFTTNPNCNTLYTGSWMYQYATWNRFYVAKVVLLQGNWLDLHPKYWPDVNTIRTDGINIIDLTKTSYTSINASNLSYTGDGTFSFNGGSSIITSSSTTLDLSSGVSMEMIFQSTDIQNRPQGYMSFSPHPQYINFYSPGNGTLRWETWQNAGSVGGAFFSPANLINNTWYHAVGTYSSTGLSVLYINGVQVNTATYTSFSYGELTETIRIGEYAGYMSGSIPICKIYNRALSSQEVQQNYNAIKTRYIGESPDVPAASGYALKQARPNLPSGYYWIQNSKMPNPLRMYVDMTEEGGGYDFYAFQGNGTNIGFVNGTHSGLALGLDLVYPRSKQHWIAMSKFVRNVLGSTGNDFFTTVYAVYRDTTGGAGSRGGNYTGDIMRDPTYYGTGTPDWRVPDGGRWWLRDTTFGEPNGDYTAFNFLGGYTFPNPYTGQDIGFNDVFGQIYTTGSYYLVSTNAKP